jgi:PAS domain S-box-containing protein
VSWNPGAERLYGYLEEEVRGKSISLLMPDDSSDELPRLLALVADGSRVDHFETVRRRKDGSLVDVSLTISAVRDPSGLVVGASTVAQDISKRKLVEAELRASGQRLALAQRAGGIGSWDWNVTTGAIVWSPEMEEMYGLPPGGFENCYENWARMLHPDDRSDAEAGLNHAVETGADWRQGFRIQRADGEERWISALARSSLDDTGACHVVGVNIDVSEQKLAERGLREAAQFFELSGDMISICGLDGSFKQLNGRWQETLGWTPDELRSLPMSERIHPDDVEANCGKLEQVLDGPSTVRFTNRYRTKSGEWRWLEWDSNAAHEEGLIYASARDVTARIEAEDAIRQAQVESAKARDEALEASAMKSAFLANMSHEIRTPLNGVIGMADLLLDSPLELEQREHARLLKGAGETLVAVVDDILEFSKIEAGATRLEYVDLDLLEAVEDACDMIADRAQGKGVEVTLDLDPELPEIVRGDAVRLRQIITNLLSNAVKFTSDGEVRITLRAVAAGGRLTTVRFEVTDTGIGIEQSRLEQMFEPFIQEDDSTTRRFGGTGLGLAIVKQLVEMMDGEVGVASTRGQGSKFWFTLPLERGEVSRNSGQAEPLAGHRLLVVDDNETNRRLLVQLARRWDLEVEAVPDAVQALARLRDAAARHEPFDCAALDMHMPRMDGLELAAAIHRDDSFPTPALVMLTSTMDHRREAREAGIDVHMSKPVRRSRLRSAIAESLGIQTRRNRSAAEPTLEVDGETSPLILIVEDNEVNQILAVSMLKRRGYRTEVAGDGREALAMLEQQRYAGILMDCQMPEMSGYDATRELRQREQGTFRTPVIAMTANALRGDREKCLASGMDDYLPKPLRPEDLDRLLQRWAPRTPASQRAPRGIEQQPTTSPLDPSGIQVFLSESGAAAATVIEVFAKQTPDLLAQMRSAIEAADTSTLRANAHRLKGGCLALAATQMAGRCQELESRAGEGTIDGTTALVNQIETDFAATLEALHAHASNT